MSRVNANGYFDSMNADARHELRRQLNAQRTEDYRNGTFALGGGVVDPLPADAPRDCNLNCVSKEKNIIFTNTVFL